MGIEEILAQFGIESTLLNPTLGLKNPGKSKLGGNPTFEIESIRNCSHCKEEMMVVIELFKDEFPEFFYPADTEFAQIRMCGNPECACKIELFLAFEKALWLKKAETNLDLSIDEAYFNPIKKREIPHQSYETADQKNLIAEMGADKYEDLIGDFTGALGTKINGDPCRLQLATEIPKCACGQIKKHILQISSHEPNLHPDDRTPYWARTSSLGFNVGNVGNAYFFVCENCGLESIEQCWDCH